MINYKSLLLGIAASFCFIPSLGFGCTDFILKSADHSCVVGRSLEFALELQTSIRITPKGEKVQSSAPNNQKGMEWTSLYGYIGMVIFDQAILCDGFNEKGLSIGALWFPDVEYPNVSLAAPSTVIAIEDVGPWILGNFATVDEVRAALPKINVSAHKIPKLGGIPPVHLSIHDAQGNSIVVEFIEGKLQIFDNPVGVLTNAPKFPWHLTNLRNYISLSAVDPGPVSDGSLTLKPTGRGSGFLGLPGDWTPPSRFIRTAVMKRFVAEPKDARTAVNTAIHLLNTVDIPYGIIRGSQPTDSDLTQWIVVKDLTNLKLYVRSYGNQNIQTVDLMSHPLTVGSAVNKIDLEPGNL